MSSSPPFSNYSTHVSLPYLTLSFFLPLCPFVVVLFATSLSQPFLSFSSLPLSTSARGCLLEEAQRRGGRKKRVATASSSRKSNSSKVLLSTLDSAQLLRSSHTERWTQKLDEGQYRRWKGAEGGKRTRFLLKPPVSEQQPALLRPSLRSPSAAAPSPSSPCSPSSPYSTSTRRLLSSTNSSLPPSRPSRSERP
jgi:hypothetical protein